MAKNFKYNKIKTNYCPNERFNYLSELLHEFNISKSNDAKRQVLANLANFAYDPLNNDHLRKLNIIPIFIDTLKSNDHKLVEFSMSGLSNLCIDPINEELIVSYDGLSKIVNCLHYYTNSMINNEIIVSAITILIFLCESKRTKELQTFNFHEIMKMIIKSINDKRIENLAKICLKKLDE